MLRVKSNAVNAVFLAVYLVPHIIRRIAGWKIGKLNNILNKINYANNILMMKILLRIWIENCCYCKEGAKVHAYSSKSPLGPYDYLGEIASGTNPFGGSIATASQQTNVFPVALTSGETAFVWQGDRWQSAPDKLKSHDFTYWYPLQFDVDNNGSTVQRIKWVDSFALGLKSLRH